jgi:pyruvate dehydrogenase E2 component (dihydrolipoamide acetyltransferase)
MPDVTMPRLSDSMEEGTILKWLKGSGDDVAKGEELVEIETDKATMTYEADADGTLEIVADEGATLAIGEVIARIGEGGGSSSEGGQEESGGKEASAEGDDDSSDGGGTATKTEEEDAAEPEEEGGEDSDEGDEAEETDEAGEADESEESEESGDAEEAEEAQPAAEADGDGGGRDDGDGGDGDGGGAQAKAEPAPSAEGNGGRPKASPVARRIAREHGIDLSTLEGTGPGGRIVKADVEAAASKGGDEEPQKGRAEAQEPEAREAEAPEAEGEETAAEPEEEREEAPEPEREREREKAPAGETGKGEVTVEEPSRIQQIIARRMAESKATIPHFTLSMDVDMEGAVELREQLKALAGQQDTPVPSYNDMVVKACAIALRDFPLVNASYKDGSFELHGRINIGVAVAGEGTLIVPTIFDADRKGLGQIAKESRALAEKVRDGKISPPELSGATFSITNLGMYGVTTFTAVINPPQAAILAVGKMEQKPVVRDGEVVARHGMNVTIACDHRILSGAPAAEFLARVKAILEQPIALAL